MHKSLVERKRLSLKTLKETSCNHMKIEPEKKKEKAFLLKQPHKARSKQSRKRKKHQLKKSEITKAARYLGRRIKKRRSSNAVPPLSAFSRPHVRPRKPLQRHQCVRVCACDGFFCVALRTWHSSVCPPSLYCFCVVLLWQLVAGTCECLCCATVRRVLP